MAATQQSSLFEQPNPAHHSAVLRRVRAMVAPVALDQGAVIDDEDLFEVAVAVYHAFGAADASGGLTRAQITAACPYADAKTMESRLDLFVHLGMLLPRFGKRFEQRFVFNLSSAAGILVVQRLGERGGVDELITLLDRVRQQLQSGKATRESLQGSLWSARRMLAIGADYLLRLVEGGTIAELIEERRHHEHVTLMTDVRDWSRLVTDEFADLDPEAYALVVEAQRYVNAREQFVSRLLDEGARARDFSVLDAEEYRTAARTCTLSQLAEALTGVVFDPPSPWIEPTNLAAAVESFQPTVRLRRRPPRPTGEPPTDDPMERVRAREDGRRQRQARRAELALDGAGVVDYTNELIFAGWPKAAEILVDLVAAGADPDLPFAVAMDDVLLVEPELALTYITPVELRRVTRTTPPHQKFHVDDSVETVHG